MFWDKKYTAPITIAVPPCTRRNEFKPSMRFHSFCAGCTEMEPVADYAKYSSGGQVIILNTLISCKHYDRCKAMARQVRERMLENNV